MKRRLRSTLVIATLLLVAGAALAARWTRGATNASSAVVAQEDFRVVVEASGKLEAAVAFEIGPPSVRDFWEYNLTWMIPEGSRVSEGEVVARFDTTQLDEQLREFSAQLETTQQQQEKERRNLDVELRELRLDLVKAEGELKKVELDTAVPVELVSFIEMEQNRLKQKLARERVAFLTEKIEFEKQLVDSKLAMLDVKERLYQGKIDYFEEAKAKFSVKAPTSGMVVYIPKQNGDRWEVGEGVWMMAKLLEVADVSTLRVVAYVLEADSAQLAPGQQAQIAVDALPGLKLESRIEEIGRIVHERSRQDQSKVFDALLPLAVGTTDELRPGMGVHISFETAVLPDQLTIPVDAVHSADGAYYVRMSDGEGRREIEIGRRNGERVVVLNGLQAGERVRLNGHS